MKFQQNQPLLRLVLQTLIYPAVLGSIIYSVIGNLSEFRVSKDHATYMVMMVSVVGLYCIDFLVTYLKTTYTVVGWLSDVMVIGLMYGAFESVNFLEAKNVRVDLFCLLVSATFTIFVIVDWAHRESFGKNFLTSIVFEILSVVIFAFLALYDFRGRELTVAVFAFLASLSNGWLFVRMYRANYGPILFDPTDKAVVGS